MNIDTILLVIAAIAFALVALGVAVPHINMLGVGLFCWVLTLLRGRLVRP